jgi:sialic acid synthase SpsE/sugar phosphate isomerase/epimerase
MIIDRDITPYILFEESSIHDALNKISNNKSRIVFTVSNFGVIQGGISDGDVRRWIVQQDSIDLNLPASKIHNTSVKSKSVNESINRIELCFTGIVEIIPLVDANNRVVAIAKKESSYFKIGDYKIGENNPAFIISEIGNNHNGDYDLAKKLVDEALMAGADCVKFQMRDLEALYRNPHLNNSDNEDLGSQYTIDLLIKYQLSNDNMYRIFDYCHKKGIMPLCTPWDQPSVKLLDQYGLTGYKVASADLLNHDLLKSIVATHKPMICSTGMSREEEIIDTSKLLKDLGAQFALLHCNSTYPVPFKDINLKYLERLSKIGMCVVGYSGHERGINVAIASLGFGAKIIEKHFTLDKNMEGNDHKVSLLPEEFSNLVKGIREVEESIGNKDVRDLTQGELMNREILGKSLVVNCDIKKGEIIQENMIVIKSPGQGLPPYRKKEVVGKKATHYFKMGDFLFPSDIEENEQYKPREYCFNRSWGIPVRFHDVNKLISSITPNLVEFHLSYKDLDLNPNTYLDTNYDMDLVIHAPELFSNDHILDLCSSNKGYRKRSIAELQRVVVFTREIKKRFSNTKEKTLIIVNVGGTTRDGFLEKSTRTEMYKITADSLAQIDQAGIEFIPQTMPPFPWHFGGQSYHNLFTEAEDISDFCEKYGYRICLDISHSKLACNYNKTSFTEYIKKVSPFSAHLHIVDAKDVDGEGLQIGDGEIDFQNLANLLKKYSPKSSFIPEIWQGHKDNGAGFWEALTKLENIFN